MNMMQMNDDVKLMAALSLSPLILHTSSSPSLSLSVFIFVFIPPADIISTVEFNHTGELLATGDKGGRVVIFQREPEVVTRTNIHRLAPTFKYNIFHLSCKGTWLHLVPLQLHYIG